MSSTNLHSKINSNESNQIHCDIDVKTSTENEKNENTYTNTNKRKQKMSTLLKIIIITSECVIVATAIIVPIVILTNKNEDNNTNTDIKTKQNEKPSKGDAKPTLGDLKPKINDAKPYKRTALKRINKNDSYLPNFEDSIILEKKFGSERLIDFSFCKLNHLYYYHYACESVNDSGWGCAWRSLQSALRFQLSLSNQKKDISFYNLFMNYGSKNKLMEIFKNMCKKENKDKILEILSKKEFAPFETRSGWAEPFISQLVLYDFGFVGDLILVNGYPGNSYAPKEVFDKTVTFFEFKEILKTHFNTTNPGPIVLDDSSVSIAIIGIKLNNYNENISIIIMDPHAIKNPLDGLYIITLDVNGRFIQIEPNNHILVSGSIYFSYNKTWMAYIPKTN